MTIVYIEEDDFFAEGVKRIFTAQGVEVIHMKQVQGAMEVITKNQPDAVLFDLRLSSLNGFELLAALKANPRTKHIPLMIWSHLASREDIQRCFDLGACEYFLKSQHHPREVAIRLTRQYTGAKENGFTLPEWAIVMGVLLLALGFAWMQFQRALDIRRDDGQMQFVRSAVSAFVAAGQERVLLTGCGVDQAKSAPLSLCKLCRDSACTNVVSVPWMSEPSYERASLRAQALCESGSREPCHVTIEADGDRPLSLETFKLRFFLARDRDGWKGGRTHTINAHGLVE